MAKRKSDKSPYDENGRWVEERGQIKGAMRRTFRRSPQHKESKLDARVELSPALKKDGTPGKKPRVRFRCAMCGELFPMKQGRSNLIQVDHIEPVVPLWKKELDMTYDELAAGIFCPKDNLQVLCSTPLKLSDGKPSCHKKKTDEENWIRRAFEKEKVHPVPIDSMMVGMKRAYQEHLKEKEEKTDAKRRRKKAAKR